MTSSIGPDSATPITSRASSNLPAWSMAFAAVSPAVRPPARSRPPAPGAGAGTLDERSTEPGHATARQPPDASTPSSRQERRALAPPPPDVGTEGSRSGARTRWSLDNRFRAIAVTDIRMAVVRNGERSASARSGLRGRNRDKLSVDPRYPHDEGLPSVRRRSPPPVEYSTEVNRMSWLAGGWGAGEASAEREAEPTRPWRHRGGALLISVTSM